MTNFTVLCDANIENFAIDTQDDFVFKDEIKVQELKQLVNTAISSAMEFVKLDKSKTEVSVLFTDSIFIRDLNKTYRSVDKPTNVLSFPSQKIEKTLGDIILCLEVIFNEAVEQQKTFQDHFMHLVVHGFLHLAGYDHVNDADAEMMEQLEIDILKRVGINNPYL